VTKTQNRRLRPQTQLIHGAVQRSGNDETCEAIYQTSGFVYGTAEEAAEAFAGDRQRYVYSRFRNPTVQMFEDRMAAFEGTECGFATASGMAAVTACLTALLSAGDRIVAPYALFGSCLYIVKDLLPRYGIESVLVDGTDYEQWRQALSRPTKLVFLETPSNPCLDVIDLQIVAEIAHSAGALVAVDNVFATPMLQRPRVHGADIVLYSATKHIDGQGRCLGGLILCDETVGEMIRVHMRHTGPALSPLNAWLLLKGLETMPLRVAAMCEGALQVARFLSRSTKVSKVVYPGLTSHPQYEIAQKQMDGGSTLVAFDIDGDRETAFKFLNALDLVLISNNLGDSKSLITHPATTTHQRLSEEERARVGISNTTLRISIGLEDPADLITDLDHALASI